MRRDKRADRIAGQREQHAAAAVDCASCERVRQAGFHEHSAEMNVEAESRQNSLEQILKARRPFAAIVAAAECSIRPCRPSKRRRSAREFRNRRSCGEWRRSIAPRCKMADCGRRSACSLACRRRFPRRKPASLEHEASREASADSSRRCSLQPVTRRRSRRAARRPSKQRQFAAAHMCERRRQRL